MFNVLQPVLSRGLHAAGEGGEGLVNVSIKWELVVMRFLVMYK